MREGALQILMAITRIFPSNEINIPKITKYIAPLLADQKRSVRHGTIELMATLGQLSTSTAVLDIVMKEIGHLPENEILLKVVRNR